MNPGMLPPPVMGGTGMRQGSQLPPSVAGLFPSGASPQVADALPENSEAPGFKAEADIEQQRCVNCKNWDGDSRCNKYGNAAMAMDTCDGFEQGEQGNEPLGEEMGAGEE